MVFVRELTITLKRADEALSAVDRVVGDFLLRGSNQPGAPGFSIKDYSVRR